MTEAKSVTLAVDAMGGDYGISITVPASCAFLASHADANITLVGNIDAIELALSELGDVPRDRIHLIAATEVVLMDDSIEVALRRKKDSSMRVAIEQVRDQKADAIISSGNTGA